MAAEIQRSERQDISHQRSFLDIVSRPISPSLLQKDSSSNRHISSLQLQVGIMAACCVALRPLVHRIFGLSTIHSVESTYELGQPTTISGGTAKTRRRTKPRKEHPLDVTVDEFELWAQNEDRMRGVAASTINDRGVLESSPAPENGSLYSAGPDGTRSEEAIIKWDISRAGPSGR